MLLSFNFYFFVEGLPIHLIYFFFLNFPIISQLYLFIKFLSYHSFCCILFIPLLVLLFHPLHFLNFNVFHIKFFLLIVNKSLQNNRLRVEPYSLLCLHLLQIELRIFKLPSLSSAFTISLVLTFLLFIFKHLIVYQHISIYCKGQVFFFFESEIS